MLKRCRSVATSVLLVLLSQPFTMAADGPIVFNKSKVLIRKDNGKSDLKRSRIELYDDRMVISLLHSGDRVREFQYSQLKQAQYSFSKSPRWKSGAGAAAAVGVFAIPIFFMKGKKHWLTLQVAGDYAVLNSTRRLGE